MSSLPQTESLPFDSCSTASQIIALKSRGLGEGYMEICLVPIPYRNASRFDTLFRIKLDACSENVQRSLRQAAVDYLNVWASPRTRKLAAKSETRIRRVDEAMLDQINHFDPGVDQSVFFVREPKADEAIKVYYVPYGAKTPYASMSYPLPNTDNAWVFTLADEDD